MYVKNLDNLTFEVFLLEMCLSKAILDQDFELYYKLAFRYALLAKQCSEATFSWRF